VDQLFLEQKKDPIGFDHEANILGGGKTVPVVLNSGLKPAADPWVFHLKTT
jgi:hypothetical protein